MIKINTLFSFIFVMIFYFVLPAKIIFVKDEKIQKIMLFFYSLIFCILITIGTLSNIKISKSSISISLKFKNINEKHISTNFSHLPLSDTIINTFMLIPAGIVTNLTCLKNEKFSIKIFLSLITGAIIATTIETLQLILPINRISQLSDILFNTISTMLGNCFSENIYTIKNLLNNKKSAKIVF